MPRSVVAGGARERMVMTDLENKLGALRSVIAGYGSVLVAYSGGVDSALVLAVAVEQLGERAVGCIGDSPSFPRRGLEGAVRLAEAMGARVRVVRPAEHVDPKYVASGRDRCYFCKSALFGRLRETAAEEACGVVADGVHLDEAVDHVFGS